MWMGCLHYKQILHWSLQKRRGNQVGYNDEYDNKYLSYFLRSHPLDDVVEVTLLAIQASRSEWLEHVGLLQTSLCDTNRLDQPWHL